MVRCPHYLFGVRRLFVIEFKKIKGDLYMRIRLSIAVLGLSMAGIVPAMAQNNVQTGQTYYNAPIYNAPQGYSQTQGNVPIYNSGNVQPLPMQQMIAGQNAPSYNYNTVQPYGTNNSNTYGGAITPEQANAIRASRNAQAQAYEAQYMQQLQQQAQGIAPNNNSSAYQGNAFSQLYNREDDADKVPTKRRVVYNERNNPLITPPRLFNPDQ